MWRTRTTIATVALLTGLGLSGCGTSDRDQIRATVRTFAAASAKRDYKTLCTKVLAPALLSRLDAVGLPCEQAVARYLAPLRDPRLTIEAITIHGASAQARVRTSAAGQRASVDLLTLSHGKAGWRISGRAG